LQEYNSGHYYFDLHFYRFYFCKKSRIGFQSFTKSGKAIYEIRKNYFTVLKIKRRKLQKIEIFTFYSFTDTKKTSVKEVLKRRFKNRFTASE